MLRSLAFAYSLFTAEVNFHTTAHNPSLHTREKSFQTGNFLLSLDARSTYDAGCKQNGNVRDLNGSCRKKTNKTRETIQTEGSLNQMKTFQKNLHQ